MEEHTEPHEATVSAERAEAQRAHTADRPATDEESADADRESDDSDAEERRRVAEHFHEMNEIGAHVKGEGAIE